MTASFKRFGALMLSVAMALGLSLAFASAASAHPGTSPHDDGTGFSSGAVDGAGDYVPASTAAAGDRAHLAAHPGSGFVESVDNDSPADAVVVIRDYGLENAPIIVGVIGAIFLVGLTFYLIRRGLMKARGAMRL